ncbi:hypothetical protein [Bifidobacterium callimiconis]|nr:hypothetical protein [Bifidobacterium callimiconis]
MVSGFIIWIGEDATSLPLIATKQAGVNMQGKQRPHLDNGGAPTIV